MTVLNVQFSPAFITSSLLGSHIFDGTPFSNTHNPTRIFYLMYPSRYTTVVVHKAKAVL
jgi:hypothetical protein